MNTYRVVKVEKNGDTRIETNIPVREQDLQHYLDTPFQDGVEYRVYFGAKRLYPPPAALLEKGHPHTCAICHASLRYKRQKYCASCKSSEIAQEEARVKQREYMRHYGKSHSHYKRQCAVCNKPITTRGRGMYCPDHRPDPITTVLPRFCIVCDKPLSSRQRKYCRTHGDEKRKQVAKKHQKASRRKHAHPERTKEDWKVIERKRAVKQQEASPPAMVHPFYGDPNREEKQREWRNKQARLTQNRKRHPGVAFCHWCEQAISEEVILRSKRKKGNPPKCCSREHAIELRKWLGTYKILSLHGNYAQQLYKAEHGEVPGYTQRKAALQRPDRTNTRRRKQKGEN